MSEPVERPIDADWDDSAANARGARDGRRSIPAQGRFDHAADQRPTRAAVDGAAATARPASIRVAPGRWSAGRMVATLAGSASWSPAGPLAAGRAAAATPAHDIASVQALYADDLLARVNAERAARSSPGQPVPALTMAPGSTPPPRPGRTTSPRPASCRTPRCRLRARPVADQMCVMAANSGDSGNGYWPGDGSDGMEAAYMASAGHRQNMLERRVRDGRASA